MSKCYYHPEKRSSATCPTCSQPICDRCRLNGTSQRCASCQTLHNKGGNPQGASRTPRCGNHKDIPTELRCGGCRKPYCPACLNGQNRCFNCAMSRPSATTTKESPKPLKGGGTGKLKGGGRRKPSLSLAPLGAGVALVLVFTAGLFGLSHHKKKGAEPVHGPLGVAIVAPHAHAVLSGPQVITLKLASPQELDRVELTVDGKYWDKLKAPPFSSDWPTSLLRNGAHEIVAKAIYRDQRAVTARCAVVTRNAH